MANVPDYGFLKGLADGMNSFMTSYQTQQNINQQKKMEEALLQSKRADQIGDMMGRGFKPKRDLGGGLLMDEQLGMPQYEIDEEFLRKKAENDPYRGLLRDVQLQKSALDLSEAQRKAADPYGRLSDPEKKVATDSSTKLSDALAIKDSFDAKLSQLDDPNKSYEQKMATAKSALKLINSASMSSPDAVGVDEAKRAGAFIEPSLINALPGRQGAVWKPDLPAFTEQLRGLSKELEDKSTSLRGRIEGITGKPMKVGLMGQQQKGSVQPTERADKLKRLEELRRKAGM